MSGKQDSSLTVWGSAQIPYSQEAEEATIGAILVNPMVYDIVAQFLNREDFFILRHKFVWDALTALKSRSEPIDYLTVVQELKDVGTLTEIGGSAYLTQLINNTPTSLHAEVYGRIVERAAGRRRLMSAADQIKSYAQQEDLTYEQVIAESNTVYMNAQPDVHNSIPTMSEVVKRHKEMADAAMRNPRAMLGLPSSIDAVNKLTRGYRKKKFYVVAGRPGMGKSSFLLNEVAHWCHLGLRVAVFALEEPEEQVMNNLVASEIRINADIIESGEMDIDQYQKYQRASDKMGEWKLFIDDSSNLTPMSIRLKCQALAYQYGLDAVVIDYLQLMSGGSEIGYDNRTQEVGYFSRSCKNMSKELNIPVIAACQLSREVEKRQDKHPMLSDLRESGDIEADADAVMMFYRDDYYNPDPEIVVSPVDIGFVKNRGGKTGPVKAGFYGEFKKFVNMEQTEPERPAVQKPKWQGKSGSKPKRQSREHIINPFKQGGVGNAVPPEIDESTGEIQF